VLLVVAAAVPYALAYTAPAPRVFAGVLFNPLDGQSYLAKMQQGWRGAWTFNLPYTAEPVPGVFIYTYYLFLGHLARLTGLGLELVYHLARMVAGGFLLVSAYRFIAHFFETPRARLGAWLLFALGSGLGWAVALSGGLTSDLWVAEAIPFLSVLSSSHFCLAGALMLWILEWALPVSTPTSEGGPARRRITRWVALALAVTALAQIQPLALVSLGVVLAALTGAQAWRELRVASWRERVLWAGWVPLGVVGVCSLPWAAYDAWAMLTAFKGWNAQNLTPSPPLWDALLSGGVPLALAVMGGAAVLLQWFSQRRQTVTLRQSRSVSGQSETLGFGQGDGLPKRNEMAVGRLPLIWLVLNVVMLYAPWALQRRLSLGIWMPMAILAAMGWRDVVWPRLARRARPLALVGVLLAAGLSNVLIFAGALSVRAQADRLPLIFLTSDEAAGLAWLGQHARGDVVLAGPETGLFIPARADARVIYGHPFETVDAAAHKQAVEAFFSGQVATDDLLIQYPVNYIFYGPIERKLGALPPLPGWRVVFEQGEVSIYAH
jgi:hypothetical protein